MTAELVCAATDPAWLERRREGITATDIVTIAGLVTWDSPWALYHRKLGLLPEPVQSDRMRLGSWLEGAIASEWYGRHYPKVWINADGLFRNEARIWQLATPDGVIRADRATKPLAVIECKTWDERQGKAEWGPDGFDQIPRKVRAQVLWQMDTLGVGTGHVAVVFLPSGEFRSYTIRHSEEGVCQLDPKHNLEDVSMCRACMEIDGLRDLGFGFWSRILRREPPDLDGLEVTTDALRTLHPAPHDQVEIDGGLVELFDSMTGTLADAKAEHRRQQNHIRFLMGDATEATVGERVVFRRTIGKRAGYTVPPGETDILRRIGKDKDQ